ncbi:hypothetical protein [Nocardia yamanashiensis]|uniref:hypothetical protein n=1 Tax=Nocardia yamanashiensis TaxID=209247 RepID=UPI00082B202E|nr:hypothetical protein [Nocardia yamanashiensis]
MNTSASFTRLTSPAELIAALPDVMTRSGERELLDPQVMVLLTCEQHAQGWWLITDAVQCGYEYYDGMYPLAFDEESTGTHVIAVIIDPDADGCGDNGIRHHCLLRTAEIQLHEDYDFRLAATYGTRGIATGQPVWSEDNDAYHGQVPRLRDPSSKGRYLVSTAVLARPIILTTA